MLHFFVTGEEAFRCPYCSCVWKQSVGQTLKIEITPLGFYRSDSKSLHPLPTGFKPLALRPEEIKRLPGMAVRKSRSYRKRPKKN
jgi:hypothetical protein